MTKKNNKAKNLKAFKEFLSDNKFTIIFSALVVVFLGGMIWLSNIQKIDLSNIDVSKEIPASENSGKITEHL